MYYKFWMKAYIAAIRAGHETRAVIAPVTYGWKMMRDRWRSYCMM